MILISEIINMNTLHFYIYLEKHNVLKCKGNATLSTTYHMKEMVKIINILENNNITYTVDKNQNIVLKSI